MKKTLPLALLVMLLWGSLFPMVKLGYSVCAVSGVYSILLFAGIRFTVCGLAITLFSAVKNKNDLRFSPKKLPSVFLMGVFAIILHYTCTYIGLTLTDSSKTALLKQAGALLYVLFAAFFFKDDRLTLNKLIGVTVGFLGIAVINVGAGGYSFGLGEILILLASLCTVFSNVTGKKVYSEVSNIVATGISQIFGGAVLLAIGLVGGGRVAFTEPRSFLVFGYVCLASIVSYCIWSALVKSGQLSGLFIIKFSEPLFACVFGALILSEDILKWQYLVAFILISLGITVTHLKPLKNKKSPQ